MKINDPYDTMGGGRVRDTRSRVLSDHLKSRRRNHPDQAACARCAGTGRSGWRTEKGETIVCESCRGFGY